MAIMQRYPKRDGPSECCKARLVVRGYRGLWVNHCSECGHRALALGEWDWHLEQSKFNHMTVRNTLENKKALHGAD